MRRHMSIWGHNANNSFMAANPVNIFHNGMKIVNVLQTTGGHYKINRVIFKREWLV